MPTFTFRCADGSTIAIEAPDEQVARSKAMKQRWGAPEQNTTWHCYDGWHGRGLSLLEEAVR